VDGKRVALREYLIFDEEVRDRLLHNDPETVTSEREYRLLVAGYKLADRDAGL